MNKIVIDREDIELKRITKKINVAFDKSQSLLGLSKITIDILKDCDLEIDYVLDDTKLDIIFNIKPNVTLNLFELKDGCKSKIHYTFNIETNSNVNINKYDESINGKEMIVTNLLGEEAKFNYLFKAITTSRMVYDLTVKHQAPKTYSTIKNNIVNTDCGVTTIVVSGYVPNGLKGCHISQNNRIINLTNNECEIRPNLYIDEFDTLANHSALIGGFNSQELFYLKSRGLDEQMARKLLIMGFLLSDLSNKHLITKITKKIKEYWR